MNARNWLVTCVLLFTCINLGFVYVKFNKPEEIALPPSIAEPFVIYPHETGFDPNKSYGGISQEIKETEVKNAEHNGWGGKWSEWESSRN